MSASVWPYSRAECDTPGCGWIGPWHLSGTAALDDALRHNRDHANAEAVLRQIEAAPDGRFP